MMIPGSLSVDIFDELSRLAPSAEIIILDGSLRELKKIATDSKQKGKDRAAAKLALQLVQAKKIKVIETEPEYFVDDAIVEYAVENKVVVATQDGELKKRLNDYKLDVVVLRQHNHLEIIKG